MNCNWLNLCPKTLKYGIDTPIFELPFLIAEFGISVLCYLNASTFHNMETCLFTGVSKIKWHELYFSISLW